MSRSPAIGPIQVRSRGSVALPRWLHKLTPGPGWHRGSATVGRGKHPLGGDSGYRHKESAPAYTGHPMEGGQRDLGACNRLNSEPMFVIIRTLLRFMTSEQRGCAPGFHPRGIQGCDPQHNISAEGVRHTREKEALPSFAGVAMYREPSRDCPQGAEVHN